MKELQFLGIYVLSLPLLQEKDETKVYNNAKSNKLTHIKRNFIIITAIACDSSEIKASVAQLTTCHFILV